MSDDESLTPASRLNADSPTPPTCAATATTNPTVASCQTPSRRATLSSTRGPYTNAAISPPTRPPTAPAQVFRGDSTGASLGPPIRVPAAMAQVSHTHVTTSGSTTSATEPRGCASECGPWRIATMNDNRAEAYRPPNTVTATAVRGRRSGPRAAATTSTTSSHTAPTYTTGSHSA